MRQLSYNDKLRMEMLREQGLGEKAIFPVIRTKSESIIVLPFQKVNKVVCVKIEHFKESLQSSRPHWINRSA